MMKFPRLKIGLIIVFMLILFSVFNLAPANKEIKNFFYLISSPIQKFFWKMGNNFSDFFEGISQIKKFKKENEELKLKIQELLSENSQLKELKKENEFLREALEVGLEKEYKLILTQVIGKDISEDTILINKGEKDGILKDLPVITQQKILVGKITEVYKNFSKVMLITNKKSSLEVKVQNKEIVGVMKGQGNLKISLEFIPKNEEIFEGDLIITTALGGTFPRGILIGEIKKIEKSDVEYFQRAEIEPYFNFAKIENLFVINNFK